MKFFSFKTPFDPSKKLSDNKIKKLFISKRKNFIENKNKNLNFFLKHRYNLINKQLINCSKILEIGSFSGASAASFVKYLPFSTVYCLDINLTNFNDQ